MNPTIQASPLCFLFIELKNFENTSIQVIFQKIF